MSGHSGVILYSRAWGVAETKTDFFFFFCGCVDHDVKVKAVWLGILQVAGSN